MVRWVNAQNFGSDIGTAIKEAGAMLFGDTLTPALRQEQLTAAQNQNIGLQNFQTNVRDWARAAPAGGGNMSAPRAPTARIEGRDEFMSTIAPHAIRVGQELGIDPRIIVAQSALETGWGRSAPGNNFFGIKSHGRDGGNVLSTKEVIDGQTVRVNDSFRAYGDPMESVLDYGAFLRENPRYGPLLSAPDFESQIAALGASGYATDPEYASKVRQIAEGIDLSPWTGSAPTMPPAAPSPFTGAPSMDPGTYNPASPQMFAEMLANGVAAGLPPEQVMDAILGLSANTFGAENQATVNAGVGAGIDYARTYGGFAADQNRQMWETQFGDANEVVDVIRNGTPIRITKGQMQPGDQAILSNTEVQGTAALGALDSLTPEQFLAYIGAEPKNVQQADSYVTPDGQVVPSIDGLTNARTGQPLPEGSIKTTITAQSREASGAVPLDKINARTLEAQEMNRQIFESVLADYERTLIDNPTSVGIVGAVRRFGQNAVEQYDQFKQMFPEQAAAVERTNARSAEYLENVIAANPEIDADGVLRTFLMRAYDPSLSQLELYAAMLPYLGAAAMAGQEGRSVTDADVRRMEGGIGNATSLFSTQRGLLSKVEAIRNMMGAQRAAAERIRTQGVGGATAQPQVDRIGEVSDVATAEVPTLPALEDISRMSQQDITSILQMDITNVPTEVLEPFLDAVARRQQELGIR